MTLMSVMAALLAMAVQGAAWQATLPEAAITADGGTVTVRNRAHAGADVWRADRTASGAYVISATLRKLEGRRREGYGFIFGGRALGTDSARYSYVMLRGDGALLVKKRDGASLPVVRNWTPFPAIRQDDAQGRAENAIEIRVTASDVSIRVNDTPLVTVPASELFTDGIVGLRVSHTVGLEVRDLQVQRGR